MRVETREKIETKTGNIDIPSFGGDWGGLMPHRPPYIMVDKLTYFDLKTAKTVFTICADTFFCFDGVMEEAGLVENIAQTCAARTGYKQRIWQDDVAIIDNEKAKIGVIAMIQSMEIQRCPVFGETLETKIDIEEEIFSIIFVRSEVKVGDETIATCRMKLFLTDKIPE